MTRGWRVFMTIVLVLFAAGLVLLGAAWLTGASLHRIVELVFGGRAGLEQWVQTELLRARALWDSALRLAQSIF